ncbi:hypothetical protein, conserved [Entamoeba dispar SAW760]|uniref:Guanylate-binding protein N-terminal domain-containing protein n=1 Tax=Entamoeba dispar (strain ATCC PRA-260 / SAW760) TaxID=370354 RepID=B0EN69_ENTDS|nr:uncharacterized protein EDI_139060 [Entamoeba dispar SAW760]EDR24013.1 hypothetical protein, conserved [Entamoeba dispar SAW760]|eukprot:EDR24013.1 hypothetical protein, conserved [Entamoeba dispar SAW760]
MLKTNTLLILVLLSTILEAKTIQFFRPNYNNMTLSITEEAIDYLKEIHSLIPVTVIGPRKSGKSFLLNSLTKTSGFELGHGSLPQTKGIEFLKKKIYNKEHEVIYFDTEGLSSNPLGFDKNIVLFGLMGSSHLIINVRNELLFNDVLSLSLMSQLAQYYHQHHISSFHFPILTWVVEDYNQIMKMNEHDLLFNHFLKEKDNPDNESLITEYNEIIQTIKQLFPVQRLFVIPEPIDDHYQFTNLDNIKYDILNQQYRNKIEELKQWIFTSEPFKLHEIVTGEQYGNYAKNFINELMKEKISPLVSHIAEYFGESLLKEVLDKYNQRMGAIILPADLDYIQEKKELYANESLSLFDKQMYGLDTLLSTQSLRTKLINSINESFQLYIFSNEQKSHSFNSGVMEESLMIIKDKSKSVAVTMKDVVLNHYQKYSVGPTKQYYFKLLKRQLDLITDDMRWDVLISVLLCFFIAFLIMKFTRMNFCKSLTLSIIAFAILTLFMIFSVWQLSILDTIKLLFFAVTGLSQSQILIILTCFCCLVIFSIF